MPRTLNTVIFVSLALLGGTYGNTIAQEYFPLHVGNEWHYHWDASDHSTPFPFFDSGDYIVKVLGDTVMPNLQRYAVLSQSYRRYLRADTAAVFAYDTSTQAEYPLYKLTALADESWQLMPGMQTTVSFLGSSQYSLFGELRLERCYRMENALTGTTELRLEREYGLVYMHYGGEPPGTLQQYTYLKGCVIDGQIHGTLLSTERPMADDAFALQQCYPSPPSASSNITIPFSLSRAGHIVLRLYDALGRECATLADGVYAGGAHRISFSGRGLSRGVYYYRLNSAEGSATKTMILR